MKIEWAKKIAKEVNGSYESYTDDILKTVVRVYMPKGVNSYEFKKIRRMIPRNFEWVGMYYCLIEMNMYILITEK